METILPVSIILTTLNEARTVRTFFDGVAAGTCFPAEIVICDGGSSDGTVDVLRKAAIPGIEIKVMEAPGATIAKGRNTAVKASTYDVLAITDAGCILDAHWLVRITAPLLNSPAVDAVSGGYIIDGTSSFQQCAAAAELPVEHRPSESFLPSSRSFAVRKSAILKAGGYPEHLSFAGEDTALCLTMRSMGMNFVPALDATVTWEPRASLKAFWKQHWLYGVGDGETGQHKRRYAIIFAKTLMVLTVLALSILSWWFLAAVPAGAVAYYQRLSPKYGWESRPASTAYCAFLLVILKDAATLLGFIKGRLFAPAKLEHV